MASFASFIKNIFLLLLLLQFAPPLLKGIRKNYHSLWEEKTKIGVIPIKGVLTDSQKTIKHMKKFFSDSDIKAIIIAMDCPGGAAGTSQAIFEELKALKLRYLKPVIIWVENIAASGGYYIACAGDHIIATPSAFVGSIGVYIPLVHMKEFIEQFKISYDPVATGVYKLATDPFTSTTTQQKEMLQSLTRDTYDQFVKDVAQQRSKLLVAHASEWAEGRIFTGKQALEKGLIDEIGSPASIENYLKQKITIVGKIEYIKAPKTSPLATLLGTDDTQDSSFTQSVAEHVYGMFMKTIRSIQA